MANRTNRWKWCLGAWLLAGATLAVAPFLLSSHAGLAALQGAFALVGALVVLRGVVRWRPGHAGPWYLLAAGLAVNALATVAWGNAPGKGGWLPAVGAVFSIAAYPLCLGAIVWMLGNHAPKRDAAVVIDAVVYAAAAWLVIWLVWVWPVLEGHGLSVTDWLPTVFYVPLDTLVLVVLWRVGRGDQRTNLAWRLVMTGVVALAIADLLTAWTVAPGYHVAADVSAAAWAVAFTCISAAALVPEMATLRRDPQPDWKMVHPHLRFVGLGIALVVPPVLLMTAVDEPGELSVLALVQILMIAAVVARAWLTVDVAVAANDRLGWRATHDPLTGLLNREAFMVELETAHHRTQRGITSAVLLFVDLDGFKAVNDDLGHDAGDEILVEVGRRIEGVLRGTDRAARFGGDEFVILCEDRADAGNAIGPATRIVVDLGMPYTVAGSPVLLGASIGVIDHLADARDADDLLRRADLEMYRVKDTHRRARAARDARPSDSLAS